jgi:inositol transporter-like SP family MFS transporter
VNQSLSEFPQRAKRPWWTAVVCGMASYLDAGSIISWAIVLVIYQHVFGLSPAQFGVISGSLTLGIAFGALVGGWLGDRFGRRSVFVVTMVLIVLGVTGMMFAQSFPAFLVYTVVVGLATGADLPVSLTTIGEAASATGQRGRMLGFSQILWGVGAIIPGLLGAVVGNMGRLGAQIMLAQLAVVAFLVMLGRLTIPESPTWLAAQAERRGGIHTVRADRASLRELFRAPYAAPFLALLIFYGLGLAASNVFNQYGTYLLVNVAHVTVAKAALTTIFIIPPAILGVVLMMLTIGSKRRFTCFTLGAIVLVATPLIPVVFGFTYQTFLLTLLPLIFAGVFAGEPIMKFWSQQSFPTLLRTTAQGAVISMGRFIAAAMAAIAPLLIAFDVRALLLVMSALYAVSGFAAWVVFRTRDAHSEFATETTEDVAMASQA